MTATWRRTPSGVRAGGAVPAGRFPFLSRTNLCIQATGFKYFFCNPKSVTFFSDSDINTTNQNSKMPEPNRGFHDQFRTGRGRATLFLVPDTPSGLWLWHSGFDIKGQAAHLLGKYAVNALGQFDKSTASIATDRIGQCEIGLLAGGPQCPCH